MGNPNITDRKLIFCRTLAEFPVRCLIAECDDCNRYFAACCVHSSFGAELCNEDQTTCHHIQLVFVDGACSNNGRDNARSGLGITVGYDKDLSWSIPVDEEMDPYAARTNQRAELLAAIEGLKKLHEIDLDVRSYIESNDDSTYILATDSEYVVKGITEWFPRWKRRNWRTADGKRPANLDLFLKLDEYTASLERERVAVGFWHVPRTHNQEADELAKLAAAEYP
ncbi:ribonuclease H-like domain-containing protein [Crepidotus variabilis]|uniref:ribonuclease H n=1 Tax=Crepidotus variabilis TaxID=179855 RepID=A0A9P6JLA6_9AGAR|nr:ribonuclease H-like domain-containing protein [Crepidotus variabilis]